MTLDVAGSTNDEVRRLAAEGAPEGTVVVADAQTAGRGRHGRTWWSPAGSGLYVSALVRPRAPVEAATRWTIAASVAACEACHAAGATAVRIEWPNDLVHAARKLGGVLCEMRRAGADDLELVIGLGLNVGQAAEDFPGELRAVATSLRLLTGRSILDREALAARYLRRLGALARQLRDGRWERIARSWEELAPQARGARVSVQGAGALRGAVALQGVTEGIAADGALRVRDARGTLMLVRTAAAIVYEQG